VDIALLGISADHQKHGAVGKEVPLPADGVLSRPGRSEAGEFLCRPLDVRASQAEDRRESNVGQRQSGDWRSL